MNTHKVCKLRKDQYTTTHRFYLPALIHDRSLSCLGTDTSITGGGVKLVIWAQTCHLSEIMQSFNKGNYEERAI